MFERLSNFSTLKGAPLLPCYFHASNISFHFRTSLSADKAVKKLESLDKNAKGQDCVVCHRQPTDLVYIVDASASISDRNAQLTVLIGNDVHIFSCPIKIQFELGS